MEAEERPTKIRKLEQDEESPKPDRLSAQKELSQGKDSPEASNDAAPTNSREVNESINISNANTMAGVLSDGASTAQINSLSRNQLKKLKKREAWEAKQPDRKAKRKEQRKRKKERDRARRAEEDKETKLQRASRKEGQLLPITVVFDCGFDELMHEKEIVSLGSQLTRCYSENRNARFKARLAISSFGGRLRERFDTVLTGAYKSWHGVSFSEHDFVSVAEDAKTEMAEMGSNTLAGAFNNVQPELSSNAPPPTDDQRSSGEVIYLSSDSNVTLCDLKPFSTYIIGGLVDRNRYKGKCYRAAMDRGVKTARLPIGEYLEMSSRHILTTNHVLEIMLKWLELGNWGEAFTEVIPKRKGGVLRTESVGGAVENSECVIEDSDEVEEE